MGEKSIPYENSQEKGGAQYAGQNPGLKCHQPLGQTHNPCQAVGPEEIGNYGSP